MWYVERNMCSEANMKKNVKELFSLNSTFFDLVASISCS